MSMLRPTKILKIPFNISNKSVIAQLWLLQVSVHFLPFHSKFPPPPPSSQFVIRLPRGPLLDFYSKRSWGAVSTPRKSHTGASVTCGDCTSSTSPSNLSLSPPLLPPPPLRHHRSMIHLSSSAPLEELPFSSGLCGTRLPFLRFPTAAQLTWFFPADTAVLQRPVD